MVPSRLFGSPWLVSGLAAGIIASVPGCWGGAGDTAPEERSELEPGRQPADGPGKADTGVPPDTQEDALDRVEDPKVPVVHSMSDLIEMAKAEWPSKRCGAAVRLGEYARHDEAVIGLKGLLRDLNGKVVYAAAASIARGADDPCSILLEALHDPQLAEPAGVLSGIATLGYNAQHADATIVGFLQHEDLWVHAEAARTLGAIHARPKVAFKELLYALRNDEFPAARGAAALALAVVGANEKETVGALAAAIFEDSSQYVRWRATEALGEIRPPASEAVPVLTRVLKEQDLKLSSEAATALGRMGPAAVSAVPALVAALENGDELTKMRAAEALGRIGQVDPEVILGLVAAMDEESTELRSASARALGRFGRQASAAVPRLTDALDDPDASVRVAAALALWRITGEKDRPIEILIKCLQTARRLQWPTDSPASRFYEALSALAAMGPDAADAVPKIAACLRMSSPSARHMTAECLGRLGPTAEAAIPELEALLQDKYPFVRTAAANALEAIDGERRHRPTPKKVPGTKFGESGENG